MKGVDFGGLVEVGRSKIDLVPRSGIDMVLMENPMVGLDINHEEALVKMR